MNLERLPAEQLRDAFYGQSVALYLPSYAGNLDIMTSAALQVAERIVVKQSQLLTEGSAR